jgi:asparagine synthase (glutamine-hydrolysing)
MGDRHDAGACCGRMIDSLAVYGRDDSAVSSRGPMALGRCLHRATPEDCFDRQPLSDDVGRWLLAADIRIDNRSELLADLGLAERPDLPDSEILLQAWRRWDTGVLDRLVGDFAFAIWDSASELLTLARDPMGERPLHYAEGPGYFAFASIGSALTLLPGLVSAANDERLAQFVADLPPSGTLSFHRAVRRIEPGTLLQVRPGRIELRRYWAPSRTEIRFASTDDYGEALREQLDRAVAARLRRATGTIGAQLSSGFDSSAVTTSAATLLAARGERMFAFTSAPRADFADPVPAGRIADESAIAARTASLYPNLDHIVVRTGGGSPLALLDSDHVLAGQPVGHVCNNLWWSLINEAAAERGVSVMLTGEAGNFSISAGLALDQLPDLLRRGRLASWAAESRALVRNGSYRWQNILNASLGPWLPRNVYLALRGLDPGFSTAGEDLTFVAEPWRDEMIRQAASGGWDLLPPRDSKARRWTLLQTFDPGGFRKRSLARWGIEERDATADRRLIEFCFALPADAYLKNGVRRPAMRRALAGRLPLEVMEQRLRGYQMADWYEHILAEDVRRLAERVAAEGENGIVDLSAVRAAVETWPTGDWHDRPLMYFYRTKLMRALSASHFVRSVEGQARD